MITAQMARERLDTIKPKLEEERIRQQIIESENQLALIELEIERVIKNGNDRIVVSIFNCNPITIKKLKELGYIFDSEIENITQEDVFTNHNFLIKF